MSRTNGFPESGDARVYFLDWLRWAISEDAYRDIDWLAGHGARPRDAANEYAEWLCALVADEVDFALEQWHLLKKAAR